METLSDIRFVDVVDVLIVTALVTVAIVWIRKTRIGRIAVMFILLASLYIVARMAGLSLLSGLFEGSFALLVLIAVVIFQKELRRFFEGIADWGLGRRSRTAEYNPADLLVECLSTFERSGIGALIVLPGKEPIDGHVDGGVELEGRLSRPLLYSIFDPHSVGHDGAVLLDGERVTKFSVHLPLSSNYNLLGDLGTRHSAALGLSEQTDALCLVVSEERRSITAAQNGNLYRIDSSADLKRTILDHLQQEARSKRLLWGALQMVRRYWIEALVSVGLVLGIWWVMIAGSVEIERSYGLPLRVVDLPPDLVLVDIEPDSVEVTFRGPKRAFQGASSRMFRITVDVALARLGRRSFTIRARDVVHPDGLELLDIRPSKVLIKVREGRKSSRSDYEPVSKTLCSTLDARSTRMTLIQCGDSELPLRFDVERTFLAIEL
jgi:uncharacterized protein (TIGR00159 family)